MEKKYYKSVESDVTDVYSYWGNGEKNITKVLWVMWQMCSEEMEKEYYKSIEMDMRLLQMCSEEWRKEYYKSVESDMRLLQMCGEEMEERILQEYWDGYETVTDV